MSLVGLLVLMTACGSSAGNQADGPVITTMAPATDSSVVEDVDPAVASETTQFEFLTDDQSELQIWHSPVAGGVTFGAPPDSIVTAHGNVVNVAGPPRDDDLRTTGVVIALVELDPTNQRVNLDSFLDFGTIGTADSAGETLQVGGVELERYSFRLRDDLPQDAPYPVWNTGAWPNPDTGVMLSPFPRSEYFLAEIPRGVILMGYDAATDDELAQARVLFQRIAPTIDFAVDLLDPADPSGPPPILHPDPLPFPVEVEIPAGGAEEFEVNFQTSPIAPGTWSLATLGSPAELSVERHYDVLVNAAGWMIMVDASGPLDPHQFRLDFRTGVDRLVAGSLYTGALGPPLDISDLQVLADADLPNLEVTVQEPTIVNGVQISTMDLRIAADAKCGENSPCFYWLLSAYSQRQSDQYAIRPHQTYRIWQLDGSIEPLVIVAEVTDDGRLTEAQQIVESLVLR